MSIIKPCCQRKQRIHKGICREPTRQDTPMAFTTFPENMSRCTANLIQGGRGPPSERRTLISIAEMRNFATSPCHQPGVSRGCAKNIRSRLTFRGSFTPREQTREFACVHAYTDAHVYTNKRIYSGSGGYTGSMEYARRPERLIDRGTKRKRESESQAK